MSFIYCVLYTRAGTSIIKTQAKALVSVQNSRLMEWTLNKLICEHHSRRLLHIVHPLKTINLFCVFTVFIKKRINLKFGWDTEEPRPGSKAVLVGNPLNCLDGLRIHETLIWDHRCPSSSRIILFIKQVIIIEIVH